MTRNEKTKRHHGRVRVDDEEEYRGELMSTIGSVLDKYGLWAEAGKVRRRTK